MSTDQQGRRTVQAALAGITAVAAAGVTVLAAWVGTGALGPVWAVPLVLGVILVGGLVGAILRLRGGSTEGPPDS